MLVRLLCNIHVRFCASMSSEITKAPRSLQLLDRQWSNERERSKEDENEKDPVVSPKLPRSGDGKKKKKKKGVLLKPWSNEDVFVCVWITGLQQLSSHRENEFKSAGTPGCRVSEKKATEKAWTLYQWVEKRARSCLLHLCIYLLCQYLHYKLQFMATACTLLFW